jgi:hypothetical protein
VRRRRWFVAGVDVDRPIGGDRIERLAAVGEQQTAYLSRIDDRLTNDVNDFVLAQ